MMPSPCPICGKPPSKTQTPFCSQGCRDRDLLQWLDEGYKLPARPGEDEDDDGLDSLG